MFVSALPGGDRGPEHRAKNGLKSRDVSTNAFFDKPGEIRHFACVYERHDSFPVGSVPTDEKYLSRSMVSAHGVVWIPFKNNWNLSTKTGRAHAIPLPVISSYDQGVSNLPKLRQLPKLETSEKWCSCVSKLKSVLARLSIDARQGFRRRPLLEGRGSNPDPEFCR